MLGSRFKKISARQPAGSRIERDSMGREVLVIVDEDGHEKRKVRKVNADPAKEREAFIPDENSEILGMEVPEFYKKKLQKEAEEAAAKEVDIFDDVGSDYDPLAGLESGSDESEEEDKPSPNGGGNVTSPASAALPPPPTPQTSAGPRDYFNESKSASAAGEPQKPPAFADPALLAVLRKARALNAAAKSEEEEKEAEREERLKKLLQSGDRDTADLDMGFGTNRMEDEEDMEESHVKLHAWRDGDGEGKSGGGKAKRKRGPKKRKGDVNSASDIMRVLERRKGAES